MTPSDSFWSMVSFGFLTLSLSANQVATGLALGVAAGHRPKGFVLPIAPNEQHCDEQTGAKQYSHYVFPSVLGMLQTSTRFSLETGTATRCRRVSTPISAGSGRPPMAGVSRDPAST